LAQEPGFEGGSVLRILPAQRVESGCRALEANLENDVDEFDNARNYLSKVQRYAKVYDNVNSISQRADFVSACLDLWERRAPFGTYNVTNPGFVTTRDR